MSNNDSVDRRDFIKAAALVGAGLAMGCNSTRVGAQGARSPLSSPASMVGFKTAPMEKVRLGFVGTGGRGTSLVNDFVKCEGVEITAVCDLHPERADRAKKIIEKAGKGSPTVYTSGDHDFENLSKRDDIDMIITATPWEWHVPVAVNAMKNGKHIGVEVPCARTVEDCWTLVKTAEETKKHCMMLENCCYGEAEMALLNAVRQGIFGEILHGEGGYLHDLQEVKFNKEGEGTWRRKYSITDNGNLYPTHGLGPVAHCMNINRGDRLTYLVSMSSPSRGLQDYAAHHLDKNDPRRNEQYKLGDVNTSLIQTANGNTIMLQHDTNTPRTYSRINGIVGTKGFFAGYPDRFSLGEKPGDINEFMRKYEHPLIAKTKEGAKSGGHGGMDFVMAYRLIDCLKRGLPLDMDVYDGVTWSVIVDLSKQSVANKSAAIDFPDFTRGAWKTSAPYGIVS